VALELSRAGATVYVTHRWGSVDESELAAVFQQQAVPPPIMVESDVSDGEDTRALMRQIKAQSGNLHIIISNVALARAVTSLADMKKSSLDLALSYSAWPAVDLMQASDEVFGVLPRYLTAISGDGASVCHDNYELVGTSKSVLETLVRYLAVRLKTRGTRVNAIRPWVLDTDNLRNFFRDAEVQKIKEHRAELFLDPQRVARTVLGLCSGLMDSITGQVITVDEGWGLLSPMAFMEGRERPFAFPEDG